MPASSFYIDGNIYDFLHNSDAVIATVTSLKAAAGASQVASALSEANSATSASAALASQNAAATSETNAATSATNAAAVVQAAKGTATPLVDGTAAVGAGTKWSPEDHRHPTDTSRAPVASPSFTGNVGIGGALSVGSDISTSEAAGARIGFGVTDSFVGPGSVTTARYGMTFNVSNAFDLGFSGWGGLRFYTGDVERFSISNSGDVSVKGNLNIVGIPSATTATAGTNTPQLATTAFVEAARLILASAAALKASAFSPQGRLTLTSGTPVMGASVAASTLVYYTPAAGNQVPLYDGTNMVPTSFAEVSQATTDTTKSPAAVAASSVYDVFVWNDAGTIRATRGPAWTNATTRSAGTALVRVNGILLNNAAITNGPAASRGTYVGTIASNATSTIDFIFGAAASGGLAAVLNVWNAYNRVNVATSVLDNAASYTYSSNTIRQARGSAGNQITVLSGLPEDGVSVSLFTQWQGAPTAGVFSVLGIGVNSTTAFTVSAVALNPVAATTSNTALTLPYMAPPVAGLTVFSSNENSQNTFSCTFNYNTNAALSILFRM